MRHNSVVVLLQGGNNAREMKAIMAGSASGSCQRRTQNILMRTNFQGRTLLIFFAEVEGERFLVAEGDL